ncbi:Retrovirus-related Pol polyprotein from transposon TNT 1-94 [Melia azedarach]|uniref:Retrovirus-related Pol polyprotein from transposon TNT 1-94 n=1 Tax=Melia azedarach TaxID=155640 RepID=A0ACC1X1M2_MELAZ|nr:Retrovirus-related Pol polyprotein from transposon TNT 1-94 [Melia azedarach]
MARSGQNNNNNNRFQPITPSASSSIATPSPSMDDIHNPFFLHNGDHPGLILVSHILTSPNYNTWSRAMLMALNAKNKLYFVDGSLLKPSSDDPTAGIWSRCNNMVMSWLLNIVSKEIADSLLYLDSAHAVWSDLHDRFHQSNAPRIFQIKQQLQVQEERQRSIGTSSSAPADSLAFNVSSSGSSSASPIVAAISQGKPKRDRPICSHCGITGHTVDHCYKLHGYPSGYKPKPKTQVQASSLQSNMNPFSEQSRARTLLPSAATASAPSL